MKFRIVLVYVICLLLAFASVFMTVACDGDNSMSEYQSFIAAHPDYYGTEADYYADKDKGTLNNSYDYDILSREAGDYFSVVSGDVTKNQDAVTFDGAVCLLNEPIVLPLNDNSTWRMTIVGSVLTGQFLNDDAETENGRVYFGFNKNNKVLYIGVRIDTTYFNYCWTLSDSVLTGQHRFDYTFSNGVFYLSVDGGDALPFDTLNFNQASKVSITDPKVASVELIEKVRASRSQNYVSLSSIGANSFAVSGSLTEWIVHTSGIYNYKELDDHVLHGKTIYQLGSSISFGSGNNGKSFVEQIGALTGSSFDKQTVSGTNLTKTANKTSYVERYQNFNFNKTCDFLVVQLSTNDFYNKMPKGAVTAYEVTDSAMMDVSTLCGAIEYIIAKTYEQSSSTVVAFYSCVIKPDWANRAEYQAFVSNEMARIVEKWGIVFIDLFNKRTLDYSSQMTDSIHPNGVAYAGIFTPSIINELSKYA